MKAATNSISKTKAKAGQVFEVSTVFGKMPKLSETKGHASFDDMPRSFNARYIMMIFINIERSRKYSQVKLEVSRG